MMTLSQLTELLGWATGFNMAYLFLATLIIFFTKDSISSLHSKIFKLKIEQLDAKYFDYLSIYKVLTLVFFMFPYLALKMMGN